MMKTLTVIILIIFSGYQNIVYTQNKNDDDKSPFINRDTAIERALLYCGFNKASNYDQVKSTISTELVIFSDSTLSIFKNNTSEKKAWQIDFKNISIYGEDNKMAPGIKYPSEFQVHIDSKTGQLLRIQSNFVETNREELPEKYRDAANMPNISGEFHDMPMNAPPLTFYDLLYANEENKPPAVRQYIAYYVTYSRPSLIPGPRNIWCLILKEHINTFIDYAPVNDIESKNRMIIGIALKDADSGNTIFFRMKSIQVE